MRRFACVLLLALVATSGISAQPDKSEEGPITPPPDGNSFQAVLARSYVERSTKDEGDGVTSFMASFPSLPGNPMFGKRESLRKLTFFTTTGSTFGKYSDRSVTFYLAVKDCRAPVIFVEPRVLSHSGIFLNRVSILADGELSLDQPLGDFKAQRETYPGGVEETIPFILTDAQLSKLRSLSDARTVVVRLTGEKGHVTLDARATKDFKSDVGDVLHAYDFISKLVESSAFDPCA